MTEPEQYAVSCPFWYMPTSDASSYAFARTPPMIAFEVVCVDSPCAGMSPGEPEHAMSTKQEKSVPWNEEKAPAEKPVTPAKQEVMQFEPVTRGRFEKSEPTIIEGEDLDVPTYLRKHIKVK